MELHIKVTPNARRSGFAGWGADEKGRPLLLVKLVAPPVEGKANRELVEFLSETLGCAKGQIRLLRGEGSRLKTVEVPDSSAAALPVK